MILKNLLLALFIAANFTAFAQQSPITTFILVRHAEKDLAQSTNDPDLSKEGRMRAVRLYESLKKTDIQAIYSTPYKRTQQTMAILSLEKGITVETYQAKTEDIDNMLKKHAGGTIVLSGHSNTTPALVNYLIGEEKYKVLEDGDYGNIIIVSVTDRGKNAKVVWMRY